jgi:hypothetical protein
MTLAHGMTNDTFTQREASRVPFAGGVGMADFNSKAEEWKECRAVVARLDGTIADLWKYGFSFITTLITASALLGNQAAQRNQASQATAVQATSGIAPEVATAVGIVLAILPSGLFAVERYFVVIRSGALNRAKELEAARALSMRITARIYWLLASSSSDNSAS